MIVRAPAKLNLCLYLGPRRDDGLHELCSLTQSLTLADRIEITDADEDEVVCDGLDGPNLGADALERLRSRGWSRPPVRVEIEMSNSAGIFQVDEGLGTKLRGTPLEEHIEVVARIDAEHEKRLVPVFRL